MKANQTFKITLLKTFRNMMALRLKFGNHSQQPSLILPKSDIPEMLKDTKKIPMRHLILSVFNSRKLGRNPEHKWIYLAITLSALILLGLGLTLGIY